MHLLPLVRVNMAAIKLYSNSLLSEFHLNFSQRKYELLFSDVFSSEGENLSQNTNYACTLLEQELFLTADTALSKRRKVTAQQQKVRISQIANHEAAKYDS